MIDEYARPNYKMIEYNEKDDKVKITTLSSGKSKSKQQSSTPSQSKQKQQYIVEQFESHQYEIPKKLSHLNPLENLQGQEEKQNQNMTQQSLEIQEKEQQLLKIQEQLLQIEQLQKEQEQKYQQIISQKKKCQKSKNEVIVIGNEVYLESTKKLIIESENNGNNCKNNEQVEQEVIVKDSVSKSSKDKRDSEQRNENVEKLMDFNKTSKQKEIMRIEGQHIFDNEEDKLVQIIVNARGDDIATKELNIQQDLKNEATDQMEIEEDKIKEEQLKDKINVMEHQNQEVSYGEILQNQDVNQRHDLEDIGVEIHVNQQLQEDILKGNNQDKLNIQNSIDQQHQRICQIEEEANKIIIESKEELDYLEQKKAQQKQINELLSQQSCSDYEDILSEQKQLNQSEFDVIVFTGSEGELFGDSQECDLNQKKITKKQSKSTGKEEYMKRLRNTERFIREEEQERQRYESSRDLRKQQQHQLLKNISYLDDNETDELDLLFSSHSQDQKKQFRFDIDLKRPKRLNWEDHDDEEHEILKYAKRSRKGKWQFQKDQWERDKLSRLEDATKQWDQKQDEDYYDRQNSNNKEQLRQQRYQDDGRENDMSNGDSSQQQQQQLRRSSRNINKPVVMNIYQKQYYRIRNHSQSQNKRSKVSNESESEYKNKQKISNQNKRKREAIHDNKYKNNSLNNSSESIKESRKKKVCVDSKQLNFTYSSDSSLYSEDEDDIKQLKGYNFKSQQNKVNERIDQRQQYEKQDEIEDNNNNNTVFNEQDDSFDILSDNEDQKEIDGIDEILKGIQNYNNYNLNNNCNISNSFQENEDNEDDDLPCDLPELGEDQVLESLSQVTENIKQQVKQQECEFLENNQNLKKYTALNKTNFSEKIQEEIIRLKARKLFLQASLQERYELQLKLYQQSLTQFSGIDRKSIPKIQIKKKLIENNNLNHNEVKFSNYLRDPLRIDSTQGVLSKYIMNSNIATSKSIPLLFDSNQLAGQYCQKIIKYSLPKSYEQPKMLPPPSFIFNIGEF